MSIGFKNGLKGVKDLGPHPQSLRKIRGTYRHNHKFLYINLIISMLSAIQDIHHGYGQGICIDTTDVTEQWLPGILCTGFGTCQRHTEDGIGTKVPLVLRTIQLNHFGINLVLVSDKHAADFLVDYLIYILNRFQYTLSQVAAFVPVTKFYSLMNTRGCSGRNNCPANNSTFGINFYFNGWIASGIKDFSCLNANDLCHFNYYFMLMILLNSIKKG